jgi:hypothetical protein
VVSSYFSSLNLPSLLFIREQVWREQYPVPKAIAIQAIAPPNRTLLTSQKSDCFQLPKSSIAEVMSQITQSKKGVPILRGTPFNF